MPALRTRDTHSRTLEVTTDAPQQLPALHIVSPTPRAFTFPTHNLSDSPYSSPSNSPFEPDHYPRSLQCTTTSSSSTPPPLFMRTLSPDSPLRSSSPISLNHKRRKSSCSSDVVERRPKKGDEDYIKRPENAFILFRRKCCEDRQQAEEVAAALDGPAKKQRQADLSKTISQQWKGLSSEERQFWEQMAKDKKKEHEQMYPNYVYRPQRAKDKDGRTKNNKKTKKFEHEDNISYIVPTSRHHGRSASAPTPPPYQSIQIPNVYHMTPSCPTSPSLLPMISRRSAHPGHPEEVSGFDYLPSNSHLPTSYPMPGAFEASLQSSDFLRSMFNYPGQRNSSTHLGQLSLPSSHDSMLLPSHQIVSPASSIGSGSSGPSSPTSGPYTPTSAFLSYSLSDDVNAQAQEESDRQAHMQIQEEFAAYNWSDNSVWSSDSMIQSDDFDLSAIPPIELGVPKYTESLTLAAPNASGLEFGQEFVHALEGHQYHDEHQNVGGYLAFDEMMLGHAFCN
ncbi:hypothetical protein B0H34DRAFT_783649 [Crassisporium funariophilum]|nr:hypothetical protein B0H34DRAFT_783649 [Crassisporium funariophilum]